MNRELPSSVSRILIVGAGGFGREVLNWARDAWPAHVGKIAGFLSANADSLDGHPCSLPILGDPATFTPQRHDGLLLAIGIPGDRRRVTEALEAKAALFLNLIHPTAIVAPTATIASGAIVCPFTIVSDAVSVGRFALINFAATIGHDASVGAFSVLSPHAAIGGGANLGEDAFMGLNASVAPRCRIGARCKIAANSCALSDAPSDSLVYGVPGRVTPLFSVGSA